MLRTARPTRRRSRSARSPRRSPASPATSSQSRPTTTGWRRGSATRGCRSTSRSTAGRPGLERPGCRTATTRWSRASRRILRQRDRPLSRSTDGGVTWSPPRTISSGGRSGASHNQGADIAVAPNGTIYVAFESFSQQGLETINFVKSTDCGSHWTQPLALNTINAPQAPGVAMRTPTFAFLATDTTDSNLVYAAYQSLNGDYDIYAQRSTNGGGTWSSPVQVNDDPGARHQIFPTIEVSHGTLSVAWYDFRNSVTPDNEALDVYYSCTNCNGVTWPAFDMPERVTSVSHNPECRLFGGGTVAFHGDYIELDALWNGATNLVHVAWADNRDVPAGQCDLSDDPGPPTNNIGNRNQNIYEAAL